MEIQKLFSQTYGILQDFQGTLTGSFSDEQRRAMMDALGQAGSTFRWNHYSNGLSGKCAELQLTEMLAFLDLAQQYIEHSLRASKRNDNLYHAYNILHLGDKTAAVGHLVEMLEGQVAILSSGMLSGEESLLLLESLRNSRLYRADQHSYILYPDRELPGFLIKNCMSHEQVCEIDLVSELVKTNDKSLIVKDGDGNYHFGGQIHNVKGVERALKVLSSQYPELVQQDAEKIKALFEEVFRHSEFTGRSGTFFAYEGLGSIYWHMVSKLLLAVQETILRTRNEATTPALIEKYIDIRKGLSFNKSPGVYGAFPTDPYSHTPKGQGAKQPGMTGMVKEEILTRQMELGFSVENGTINFDFLLLDKQEFLNAPTTFHYWNTTGNQQQFVCPMGSIGYTICQVPVLLQLSNEPCIRVFFSDGSSEHINGFVLDHVNSQHLFKRDGVVRYLLVSIP